MVKSVEKMTMEFHGDDEISLETLRDCLDITVDTLKYIADQTLGKDDFCKFVIKEVRKGSFVIDIAVMKDIVEMIVGAAGMITGILVSFFQIRKHLKGKDPSHIKNIGSNIEVTNANGNVIVVDKPTFHLYTNSNDTEKNLSKLSDVLTKDSARSSFTIFGEDDNGNVIRSVEYSKEDLAYTSKALDVEKLASNVQEYFNTIWLKIKKSMFVGDGKWEFISMINNDVLSASIEDEEFMKKVHSGDVFLSADTRLQVQLRCRRKEGENGEQLGKINYAVMKVLEIHNPNRNEQLDLFN